MLRPVCEAIPPSSFGPAPRAPARNSDTSDCVTPKAFAARLALPWWFAMHCPFWAASAPPVPLPWVTAAIQQTGVVGGVDRNVFRGTLGELCEVFGLPEPAPSCGS